MNIFNLLISFVKGQSSIESFSTLAVDFVIKTFQLSDGSVVNCIIYDTCGQERYNSINESYYRKADAALLVYDISQKPTFEIIKDYYCPKIKEFCKKNIPIILLGNKADLEGSREVETEEGIQLALDEKYQFKEASCLKNENVADAFEALIEMWNIEMNNRRNDLINKINNEEEMKPKTEVRSSSVEKKREKDLGINENRNNHKNSITLKRTKKGETKKSSGCCWIFNDFY